MGRISIVLQCQKTNILHTGLQGFILPKDEVKMARLLFISTSLDIKIKGIEIESFQRRQHKWNLL